MDKQRFTALAATLAAGLFFLATGTAQAQQKVVRSPNIHPTSEQQGFWYGQDVPPTVAQLLHNALTTGPTCGGPIRQLMNALEAMNPGLPSLSTVEKYVPNKSYGGYTLLSPLGARGAVLVDMNGTVVRRWNVNAFPAKLLPDGSVMGYRGNGRPGYGDSQRLVQLDWCDSVGPTGPLAVADPTKELWSYGSAAPGQNPAWGTRVHHDYQREGNSAGYYTPAQDAITDGSGKNWLLVHREPPAELTQNVSDLPLQDDAIVEVNPDGTVAWVWNAWEHVDQMGFDPVQRAAIRTNHVGSYSSAGNCTPAIPESDWQHLNAISQLGPNKWYAAGDQRFHPDNILWDGRTSNIIAIVARHDGPTWKSGDIVWRSGPTYTDLKDKNRVGQIIGQHTAHMIPEGLPGAGNILVFDNGGLAGFGALLPGLAPFWPVAFRSYSRAVEFDPVTMEKVWEYTNETDKTANGGDPLFFSWFISSVQRLPNGNTLITEGNAGRVFEVTPVGEIVWQYRQQYGFVYRAYRYPASFLPLNRTCP